MRPIQVWLPAFNGSLGPNELARDAQRAIRSWHGETRLWLMPELTREIRWHDASLPWAGNLAIPSEHLDRIDIHHIGANGHVWGPNSQNIFPEGRVSGLLDAWLNVILMGGIKQVFAPDGIRVRLPHFSEDGVKYEEVTVEIEP